MVWAFSGIVDLHMAALEADESLHEIGRTFGMEQGKGRA